jgi:hypothetical protein
VLVGREEERARLTALLDRARASVGGALVVRGEAGAGKTVLLADLVAGAADVLVLRGHGVESEAELPYAGLHQLLRPVLAAVDGLAAPQADALRAAFGLRVGRTDERFLVSLATLSLLGELSERRSVLCVLDDAHWLDRSSLDALGFVARRLRAERVAMLFALREPAPGVVGMEDLPTLRVGALDAAAAARLIEEHAGVSVAPDVRVRLVEATGGNALALAELARALSHDELEGVRPLPVPLPLTAGVEQAFLDRVRRLPPPTQTLLLVAAADDTARLATAIAAAGRLGVPAEALTQAERARRLWRASSGSGTRWSGPRFITGPRRPSAGPRPWRSPTCCSAPVMPTAPPGTGPPAPWGRTPGRSPRSSTPPSGHVREPPSPPRRPQPHGRPSWHPTAQTAANC